MLHIYIMCEITQSQSRVNHTVKCKWVSRYMDVINHTLAMAEIIIAGKCGHIQNHSAIDTKEALRLTFRLVHT